MKEKIKIICLVLIALSIFVVTAVYCWETYSREAYFKKEEKEEYEITMIKLRNCVFACDCFMNVETKFIDCTGYDLKQSFREKRDCIFKCQEKYGIEQKDFMEWLFKN